MPIEIVRGPFVVRSWRMSDADALSAAIAENLEHLRPFLTWASSEPISRHARRALITRWAKQEAFGGDEPVGLFLGGEVVGGSGLHRRIGAGGLEIGYWVHVRFVRRGIACLAAQMLTDLAFSRPDIDRLEIHHDRANVASMGVPPKLGFTLVGEEPRAIEAPAETGVHLIWRVTRDQWLSAPRMAGVEVERGIDARWTSTPRPNTSAEPWARGT